MKRQPPTQKNTIHLRTETTELQDFRASEKKRGAHMPLEAILAIVLFFLFWGSLLLIVPYRQWVFSPAWIFESVRTRFEQLYLFLFGGESALGVTVWQYLAIVLIGTALAACGTVFQGSFRNVLAGPSTMGVMSGGTLGCLLYLLCMSEGSTGMQQLCTLLGCFAGVALVLVVATISGRGKLSASAMILSGTVFSSITQSFSMLIQYYMLRKDPSDERIEAVKDLMMGSLNRVTTGRTVLLMGIPILLCLGILLACSGRLNVLSLGEEEALTMGVNVPFYRYLMIVIGTVLTAVVVAFCGHIGFLGFMIPLVGRKLAGPNMRKLLPVSMLLGAILLMVVFDLAYIVGLTDYLNLFTSSIGSIVMLVCLLGRKEKMQNAAFAKRAATGLDQG